MIKKLFLISILFIFSFADLIKVNDFEVDLFSNKSTNLKKVELSLMFEGRDIEGKREEVVDALNIVISSFYIEELFTSLGKERFKKALIAYASKKYDVDIDNIFIRRMVLKQENGVSVEEFIKALKEEGYTKIKNKK